MVKTEKVAVIGIGNVLMGDDAVGPCLVRLFDARCIVPEGVSLLDGGTAGLALPSLMEGHDAVIIVDTVHVAAEPGTIHRFDRETLVNSFCGQAQTPHDPGLRDALLISDLTGTYVPDLVLIGVVPERLDGGVGLSPAVHRAMDALVGAVAAELARLGMPVTRRATPLDPDLWWERAP